MRVLQIQYLWVKWGEVGGTVSFRKRLCRGGKGVGRGCQTAYSLWGAQSLLEVPPRNELVPVAHRGAYLYVWVRGRGVRGTCVMHIGVNEESVFLTTL